MGRKRKEGLPRPGRFMGAERRRVARQTLREFYKTAAFEELPSKIRLSILELCSREPEGAELSNQKRHDANKAKQTHQNDAPVNAVVKDVEFHTDEQSFVSDAFCGGNANG